MGLVPRWSGAPSRKCGEVPQTLGLESLDPFLRVGKQCPCLRFVQLNLLAKLMVLLRQIQFNLAIAEERKETFGFTSTETIAEAICTIYVQHRTGGGGGGGMSNSQDSVNHKFGGDG